MSDFIEELANKVGKVPMSQILSDLYSLGENARRMLEIGIVQDELVKLGLKQFGDTVIIESMGYGYAEDGFCPKPNQFTLRVDFDLCYAELNLYKFEYESPTWQEDLINKVKELIK